uniref:Chaperone protein dnaJ 15-like n=1 Tax=Elaeis guineensis var. tenera TaxID=51953 RepID=A0A6J0PE08_ELAGV
MQYVLTQALESDGMDMEIDLSNLGTVNTMFAALFSKLGVPIKTTISATVLEEALNGTVTVRPLPIGTSVNGKLLYFEQEANGGYGLALQVIIVLVAIDPAPKVFYDYKAQLYDSFGKICIFYLMLFLFGEKLPQG